MSGHRATARPVGAVCAVLLVLTGCTGRPANEVVAKDDPFRPFIELESGHQRTAVVPGQVIYRLIAQIDRQTAATTVLVKVQHSYLGKNRSNLNYKHRESGQ